MYQFIDEMCDKTRQISFYDDYEDEDDHDVFRNVFHEECPDLDISKLKLVKICSDDEFAVFTIEDEQNEQNNNKKNKILLYRYYDDCWSENENTSKNICGYDCDFYLFEDCSSMIPADVIAKLSISDDPSIEMQKIIEYFDITNIKVEFPLEIILNSNYKLIFNFTIYTASYIIKKNEEIVFQFDEEECMYTDDRLSVYVCKKNIIIHCGGNNGGSFVIKNILN